MRPARSVRVFLVSSAAGIVVATGLEANADAIPSGTWAYTHCNSNSPTLQQAWKRSQARPYAYSAVNDGYDWGGGCWIDDDINSTGNSQPSGSGVPTQYGEGPDCSGLVNKAWALGTSTSDARPFYWLESTIRHGVTSDTFHDSTTAQWTHISKSYSATQNMDGFAKDGHVALIYVEGSSNNTDQMVEAYDERDGTWIHSESYRGSSSYVGLARNNWTPECYPSCSP